MAQAHVNVEGTFGMSQNPYKTAGWLSLLAAVVFPVAFGIGMLQGIISAAKYHYQGPMIGVGDILMIFFTVLVVYTLAEFRSLLNERYGYRDIDTLITLAIWWNILFQAVSLAYRGAVMILWPIPHLTYSLLGIGIFVIFMSLGGVIDIVIALRLLKEKDRFNDLIKALAYINMASGICGVSIILTPFALILIPIWWAVLGMVFLREKEEVEFV